MLCQHDTAELKNTWLRKRKITTTIGISLRCLSFFEYTSVAISALYYYKNLYHTTNPNFFYGCTMSVIYVSGVISANISAKYMDRTRNLRSIVICLLSCNIVGNLIYTSTFSPWCPVIGRFVCGFSAGTSVCFSGKPTSLFLIDPGSFYLM